MDVCLTLPRTLNPDHSQLATTRSPRSPAILPTHATTAPARHSRPGVPAGFAVGAPADFVLLRADPRVDIRNTRQIHGVILRGRLLTRQDLDPLSIDELHERIATLKAEIARVEAHMDSATRHRSAAEELFKKG